MAFWGTEVKSGKPFSLKYNDGLRKRLHISQATLAAGNAKQTCLVQCSVGHKSPVLLGALLPKKTESLQLNLEFDEDEDVVFSVIGPRSVHLTGFYPNAAPNVNDDESESYGEDIANSENEEFVSQSDEDEYEDSFIDDDDDLEVILPSPTSTHGVADDVDKKRNKKKPNKPLKKRSQVVESDDESISWNLNSGSCIRWACVSDSADKLPISSMCKNKKVGKNTVRNDPKRPTKKGKGVSSEVIILDSDDHSDPDHKANKSEAKANDIVIGQDPIIAYEIDVDPDANNRRSNLLPSPELGLESGVKPKKRKECSKEENIPDENSDNQEKNYLQADTGADDMNQDLRVGKENVRRPSNKTSETGFLAGSLIPTVEEGSHKPKKKGRKREEENKTPTENDLVPERKADENTFEKAAKKKKQKIKVEKNDEDMDVPVSFNGEKENSINEVQEEKIISGSSRVRTLSNGLVIEDLEKTKSDGKAAALGRKLKVRYTAKLKENGEIIDSNGKAPYRFRLGDENVMEGWNIGLDGMRAGDKRRLVVPPSLGVGSKGTAENVQPDSSVIYDVELLRVR
ncbi:Peptidylprolyl isomerase [Heracleum sosnowskyi]|uniref:peptidylprolyl isomerase n=1 Tax=Heracleum sosnowskyi TaxID=360622 RepID=A0AAD8HUD3_9APIA|nr:Peptidylprolyl isomerase [Heracleum sosnowskyi]